MMNIKDLLAMYVGQEIKLIYRDKSYIVGVLEFENDTFYVGRIEVDTDKVYGWDMTKD